MDDAVAPGSGIGRSAIMQFLCSRRLRDGEGEVLEAGRLAVCWNEQEVGPGRHQLLTEETSLARRALRAVTRPAVVENAQGRRTSGTRIGPAAHDLVTRSGMPLTRGGVQRLRLAAALPTARARTVGTPGSAGDSPEAGPCRDQAPPSAGTVPAADRS
ncbi:hypothetical protein ACFCX4_29300 [Kitasatospora sp. NPDC056327]|uniref:hypothetical protein n=1 Tax=Kitasatospora sp. NPDC056327 TaxID=3345785 RepID=UPI0035D90362